MITLLKYTGMLSHSFIGNRNAVNMGKRLLSISEKELKYSSGLTSDLFKSKRTNNLLNMPENFIKQRILEAAKTPAIGKGKSGSVYRIPNTNHAVKIANNSTKNIDIQKQKLSFDVTLQEKGNHIVAKLGDDVSIMRFIEGEDISGQFSVNDFKVSSLKNYIRQMHLQAQNGMRLDKGGKNTKYNKLNGTFTAFDFYPNPPAKKYEFINDAFIQTYNCAKSPAEAEELLTKITLGYLDLLKDGTITKSFSNKLSTNIGAVKDIFKTDKALKSSKNFPEELEVQLEKIMYFKSVQGLSPQMNCKLDAAIVDLQTLLASKINIT